jgi:hypothetical protein
MATAGGGMMAYTIRRVDYFYTTVRDQPGSAYTLLAALADQGINLVAFTAVPVGPMRAQLTLFPHDSGQLQRAAKKAGMQLDGPNPALLVQGDDELGALAKVHERLYQANVNVFASSGVADNSGSYGYVLYVKPEDYERAAAALKV